MPVIEHANIGDHLRHIMNTIDTLVDPVELPSTVIDTRLEDLSIRVSEFVDVLTTYNFSLKYFGSALYQITYDLELLVCQVPYSDRAIVRNTIAKVRTSI